MSRNGADCPVNAVVVVTSRKGRVSRNEIIHPVKHRKKTVTSRKGRVSRNELLKESKAKAAESRPARGV